MDAKPEMPNFASKVYYVMRKSMEKKILAPQGVAIELPTKIIKVAEKLRDGRSLGATYFTGKELNAIGLCYHYGHIVNLDYAEAVKWYLAADAKRHRTAAFNLYLSYRNGEGVMEDGKKALYWLRKAARHNLPDGQFVLGMCYYKGDLVRRNRRLAELWLQKGLENALKECDEVTLTRYGALFYLGEGVFEQDLVFAILCFEKAASKGYCSAIIPLISIAVSLDYREDVEYWWEKFWACTVKDIKATKIARKLYNDYMKGKKDEK